MVARPYNDFRTCQLVYGEAVTKPYVGFENTNRPEGWQYDIKRWCSIFDLKLPSLPRLFNPSTQGIVTSEYFKSGVGDVEEGDLYLSKLIDTSINNERQWVPRLENGYYYRYNTPYFYYSDNSRIQQVHPNDNKDGRNVVRLETEPLIGDPILAATFCRHPITKSIKYKLKVAQVSTFTGMYSGEEELETVTELGKILWSNVDITKREFIVDTSIEDKIYLRFNRDFVRTYGTIPIVYDDLALCEQLGISDGTDYQVFSAENFPVLVDPSYHLYIIDAIAKTWEEAIRVDTWFELLSLPAYPGIRYFVDRDFNIIYFGGIADNYVPALGSEIVVVYDATLRIEYEENFDSQS
ncbi:MAG: hypothetical protein KAX49_17245 [Halanaerobiales bacterium]|nr:hypothetical protein [Halanaerobiales bacterium]